MKRPYEAVGRAMALYIPWACALPGLCVLMLATPATALSTVSSYADVLACRGIADPLTRLDCFDKAVKTLAAAETSGDVVVINRARVEEVKRQAFGLPNLEALKAFEIHGPAKPIDNISFVIASAHQTASGRWSVASAEGQVWVQIDSADVYPDPAAGRTAVVSRGALGSFFLKIGDAAAFRVHREQ